MHLYMYVRDERGRERQTDKRLEALRQQRDRDWRHSDERETEIGGTQMRERQRWEALR